MKQWLKYLLYGLLAALLLLIGWGVLIEPRLIDVEAQEAPLPHLPVVWEGRRVARIADLQVGMWFGNTSTVRRIVARLISERPALVLIAGDFIYKPIDEEEQTDAREEVKPEYGRDVEEEIRQAVALMRLLVEAGLTTFAVLGNHDYAMGEPQDVKQAWIAQRLREALITAGIRVLNNEAAPVNLPHALSAEDALFIAGLGPHFMHEDQPDTALAQVPVNAPRIVFMHNPQSFEALPADSAPLAVAGHTHGGQVRLPFTPEWTWMNFFKEEKVHADGWIHGFGAAGNRLYVNRGIGFSYAPIRINCLPELTMFTLRRAGT